MWNYEQIFNNTDMKLKLTLTAAAIALSCAAAFAQDTASEHEFTVVKENPITSIKDQHRSGTCWCFSAISFIESEILRTKGLEVDLSEMFVVGKSYHDRAIKYVRLDGHLNLAAGSSFGDVLHVIKDYGIVPNSEMPGLNYGTEKPEHYEMDAAIKGFTDAINARPNKTLTPAWTKALDGIVAAYLGEYPTEFTVDGKTYTPESYRDYLGINYDDYVNLSSFAHQPWYEPFVVEVCDNWRWDTAYNLPINELMEVMENAVMKGYTVAWGSDVSEKGFTRNGTAVIVEEQKAKGSDMEHWTGKVENKQDAGKKIDDFVVTDEMRLEGYNNKTTTDDHGMHIYGIAKDQNGELYYMVKNSWGESGKYKGIWYASEDFVSYKTLNIVVHKDALPKHIAKKLGIK